MALAVLYLLDNKPLDSNVLCVCVCVSSKTAMTLKCMTQFYSEEQ